MFHRLLICTDFNDSLFRLVHFLPSLAAMGLKQVVFLNVIPLGTDDGVPMSDREQVERAKRDLDCQQVPDHLDVKTEVLSGRAIEMIDKTARRYQSDLIVLGSQTRSLLTEKLFGSTTIGLCQKTVIPMLSLRPQLIATYTTEELDLRCRHLFRCLLIPYDGSESSQYLVQQVKHYAQHQTTPVLERCLLCWVVGSSGYSGLDQKHQIEMANQQLQTAQASLEAVGITVATEICTGDSVRQTLDVALKSDISAIAISSIHIGKLWELSVSSFAGDIMRQSWYPVLFFPPQRG